MSWLHVESDIDNSLVSSLQTIRVTSERLHSQDFFCHTQKDKQNFNTRYFLETRLSIHLIPNSLSRCDLELADNPIDKNPIGDQGVSNLYCVQPVFLKI